MASVEDTMSSMEEEMVSMEEMMASVEETICRAKHTDELEIETTSLLETLKNGSNAVEPEKLKESAIINLDDDVSTFSAEVEHTVALVNKSLEDHQGRLSEEIATYRAREMNHINSRISGFSIIK